MLAELRDDNQRFVSALREAHDVCDEHNDVATTSLLEVYIDEAERRVWFLYEAARRASRAGIRARRFCGLPSFPAASIHRLQHQRGQALLVAPLPSCSGDGRGEACGPRRWRSPL